MLLALGGATSAAGETAGAAGAQVVGGTVEPQFGAAIQPDGQIAGSSSTIAVNITRTVENGVEVITISPKD